MPPAMCMAASVLFCMCAQGWQVPSWSMLLSERGAVTETIDGTWCGHVQGMCVTSNAFFFAYHNQIVKTDWNGRLLARRNVLIHTGDICAWNGRVYTAVSNSTTGYGKGRIQVFDEDLNLVKETALPRGSDGITCLNGVIYIGLGSGGTTEAPHRGNWYGKYDAETLEPIGSRFRIDHGYDTSSGVQNMATDGNLIYVNFYCPDETADTPCLIVFDRDMNVLDAHLFGWRQGLDVVPGGEDGAVRFAYCTTANWMSSSAHPILSVQAVVRFAELKDGAIRTIDDAATSDAALDAAEYGAAEDWAEGRIGRVDFGDKVAVAHDATGAITNLTATPACGETITLPACGMTFGDNAVITLASTGTLAFTGKVQATGALSLVRGDGAYLVWRGSSLAETTEGHPLAFPGVTRDDIDFVSATSCAVAPGRFSYVSGPNSSAFYVFNRLAAGHVYSARIQLTKEADGLHARCRTGVRSPRFGLFPDEEDGWLGQNLWGLWGKGDANGFGLFGYDSDPAQYGGTFIGRTSALAFRKLVARRKGMTGNMQVRFDGGASFGGETTIDAGVEAVIAVSDGDDAATLAHPFRGDGDVTFVPIADKFAYGGEVWWDEFIAQGEWKVLAANRSLATLESIIGYMQGKAHNATGNPSRCGTFFYAYDTAAETATCQFQFNRSAGVKYVKAKLRQNGNNVEIAAVGAGFYEDAEYGDDFTGMEDNVGVSTLVNPELGPSAGNFTSGYGIRQIRARFGRNNHRAFATLANDMSGIVGGAVSFLGGKTPLSASVTSNAALTAYGEVNVGSNAAVLCKAPGLTVGTGVSGGGGTVNIGPGGTFRRKGDGQIGSTQRVVLDGGTLLNEGGSFYLNDVTLRDGAHVRSAPASAYPPRLSAYGARQLVRVEGPGLASIDDGIRVYGSVDAATSDANDRACRFEVADPDGCCNLGRILLDEQKRPQYFYFPLEKYGAGTLNLMGDCRNVRMAMRVFGGVLRLCASGIATNDVMLAGGTFAAAQGTVNGLGALSVSAAGGVLEVAPGATLSFADSHAVEWKGGVAVKGLGEGSIRFGTTGSGLTAAQCDRLRTDTGRPVVLDSNGYLAVQGLAFFVR